jgi:hypothetical protein
MKKLKIFYVIVFTLVFSGITHAQVFWIGTTGSAVYSWFSSPNIDNIITSDGWGWNLGIFARYGKRPYFQVGGDWTWSMNTININDEEDDIYFKDDIKFNNFDFSVLVGYEIFQKPMFKLKVQSGPFLGSSFLFSGDYVYFSNSDFKNPQFGIASALGFQFTNLVIDFEYSYHFTNLFKPIEIDDKTYQLGSKLQLIRLKIGLMF